MSGRNLRKLIQVGAVSGLAALSLMVGANLKPIGEMHGARSLDMGTRSFVAASMLSARAAAANSDKQIPIDPSIFSKASAYVFKSSGAPKNIEEASQQEQATLEYAYLIARQADPSVSMAKVKEAFKVWKMENYIEHVYVIAQLPSSGYVLRKGPSKDYEIITELGKGTTLFITAYGTRTNVGWVELKITTYNSSGKKTSTSGWMYLDIGSLPSESVLYSRVCGEKDTMAVNKETGKVVTNPDKIDVIVLDGKEKDYVVKRNFFGYRDGEIVGGTVDKSGKRVDPGYERFIEAIKKRTGIDSATLKLHFPNEYGSQWKTGGTN